MRKRKIKAKECLIIFIVLFMSCRWISAQNFETLESLPLETSSTPGAKNELVVYLTGDGGWNSFSRNLKEEFEGKGFGVVALNCRKYFWKKKTPEQFARDVEYLSNYFMARWKKASLVIVGYSFGADVASFLPRLLSSSLHDKVRKIALLSPSSSTDFVVRLSDLFAETDDADRKYKVGTAIEKSKLPVACIFGQEEQLFLKHELSESDNLKVYQLPGGHHYNNDFSLIMKTINP